MAIVQFYSQSATEGLVSFQLAEANLLEATENTHYTQDFLYKTTNPTTQEDVWSVNISIPLAGMDYVSPNKNYQPLPEYPLIRHNDYPETGKTAWFSDLTNPEAIPITQEPSDWSLHWRDKYNNINVRKWDNDTKAYYFQNPLLPSPSGQPPASPSELFPVYETNQGRHIYWTMDGNYFPITWGWFDFNNTIYYGLQFAWAPYGKYNVNWDARWENVNNPRFAGVSGPLVYGNSGSGENYFSFLHNYGADTSLSTDIDPPVYFNFIGFKYKFTDTSGQEPVEKTEEFIGLIAWEESIDGIPQSAKIVGLSKNFFGARKKPANGGPISSIQGGTGTFDGTSNNHGDRTGATAGLITSNWGTKGNAFLVGYNNYLLSYNNGNHMAAFGQFVNKLWDPDIWDGFANKMMNPIQSILSCQLVPGNLVPASIITGNDTIHAAGVQLTIEEVPTFGTWYVHKWIGSIDLTEYTGSFADYTNTSIYINLPYVGLKPLDTAACMSGWLSVDYMTDLFSGDCTAIISVQDRFGNTQLRYEYKGHCGRDLPLVQRVPLSTQVGSALIPAAVGGAVTAAGGLIAGSIAGSVVRNAQERFKSSNFGEKMAAAAGGAAASNVQMNAEIGVVTSLANATSSMATSAASSAMAGQNTSLNNASGGGVSSPINTNCWVLITRPQWSNPELYERERAYASDISGTIGDFSGFLAVASAELNDIACTDTERSEIMQYLAAGIYVD